MPYNQHHYSAIITWTGNTGLGTGNYKAYNRSHEIKIEGKPVIEASSDPAFRGDKTRHNPEDLLLASVSGCHMLWFLHLCADAGIVVTAYEDKATGTMETIASGSGRFTEIVLHPSVTVTDTGMVDKANSLHQEANKMCFIANSVNFPIRHQPVCKVEGHETSLKQDL